jgi:hypothetical protein
MRKLILIMLIALSPTTWAHNTSPAQGGTMTVNYGGTPGTISITHVTGEACTVTAQAGEGGAGTALLRIQNTSPQPGLDVTLSVTPVRQPLNNSETISVILGWSATGNTVNGTTDASCNGSGVVFFSVTVGTTVTSTTPLPLPPATQTVFSAPSGRMPATAVVVTATGTFGNASLSATLDIVQALATTPASGFAASTYNVYVFALIPSGVLGLTSPVIVVKARAGWGVLRSPVAPYLENVAQGAANNQILIEIFANNDISSLVGTEIYVGYGTTDTEMLTSGRYRGVYRV